METNDLIMLNQISNLADAFNNAKTVEEARQRHTELFNELIKAYGPARFTVENSQQNFVCVGCPMIQAIYIYDGDGAPIVIAPDQGGENNESKILQ